VEVHEFPSSNKATQRLNDGSVATMSHFEVNNCNNMTFATKMLLRKKDKNEGRRGKIKSEVV
jgi:hypothetical protein